MSESQKVPDSSEPDSTKWLLISLVTAGVIVVLWRCGVFDQFFSPWKGWADQFLSPWKTWGKWIGSF